MCAGADREAAEQTARALAEQGYRVLALAEGRLALPLEKEHAPREPSELTYLGLVGMIDPLRPGVAAAVKACREAGVQVAMVTGDHPVTALAIARELGLATSLEEVLSGSELNELAPEGLAALMPTVRVFARTTPRQKLQIVEAARQAGHFVAVTGDGVNDAPALRAANIGVAMGTAGTDVAREAAEVVITDDDFATIVAGVEEGRVAYDNVRKVIYLLISTGAAELVLILLSLIFGSPLPLLPVQLLWLNLVTNGIQDVALAFEPKEADVLRRAPRSPKERIFDGLMIERTVLGAAWMGGLGFVAFYTMLEAGYDETRARNGLLLLMVLFENVHVGNCRSETRSIFTMPPFKSPILLTGTAIAFLVHIMAMHVGPLQRLLGVQAATMTEWMIFAGLALSLAVVMELQKLIWRMRSRRAPASQAA
jgi:P-type Ca2+ transporter type 2C